MSENVHDEAADESVPGDAPVADTGAALSVPVSSKRWYVVHAYSGMEKSVMRALTERIERAGMQDQFGQILVPIEEVVEVKNGVKSVTERRFYPGYVLVEMEMTDESWHLVKNTSKVTGFIGGKSNKPTPISAREIDGIMQQMQEGVEKPRPKICTKWASKSASRMVRSPTSTAMSKKSITRNPKCASRSPFSAALLRWNSNSARSKKFKYCSAPPGASQQVSAKSGTEEPRQGRIGGALLLNPR